MPGVLYRTAIATELMQPPSDNSPIFPQRGKGRSGCEDLMHISQLLLHLRDTRIVCYTTQAFVSELQPVQQPRNCYHHCYHHFSNVVGIYLVGEWSQWSSKSSSFAWLLSPPWRRSPQVTTDPSALIAAKAWSADRSLSTCRIQWSWPQNDMEWNMVRHGDTCHAKDTQCAHPEYRRLRKSKRRNDMQ